MKVARVNDSAIIEYGSYGVKVIGIKDDQGVWQVKTFFGTVGEATAVDELTKGEPVEYHLHPSSAKTAIKFLTKMQRKITLFYGDCIELANVYKDKCEMIVTQ